LIVSKVYDALSRSWTISFSSGKSVQWVPVVSGWSGGYPGCGEAVFVSEARARVLNEASYRRVLESDC